MDTPPISPDALPRVFDFDPQPDGTLPFKIEMDGMTVEGTLFPEYAVALLGHWVIDIHQKAMTGESFEHTPFAKAGIKIHPNAGKYSAEETTEALNRFIKTAAIQAMRSILTRMVKLPAQAFIEGIISVVLDMEETEIISIEGSRAKIWNDYTGEAGRTIKRELKVPVVLKPRRWNRPMRRKALPLYEDTLKWLQELKRTYFSTSSAKILKQQPDLKPWEEVKAEYEHLSRFLERLENGDTPKDIAVLYVGERFGSYSMDTTWDQIKKARGERKQALESGKNY
jgi:hypothetical protein